MSGMSWNIDKTLTSHFSAVANACVDIQVFETGIVGTNLAPALAAG